MAYDDGVAERLRALFVERLGVSEKRMFGGLAFMVRGQMLVGIIGESLMARVGPDLNRILTLRGGSSFTSASTCLYHPSEMPAGPKAPCSNSFLIGPQSL